MADRAGRLEDRPKRIKAELLPFDDEPIGPILEELERWGFIRRYEVDGRKLIWIPKFLAHQNPHKAEKPSEFPAHPEDYSCVGKEQGRNEHSTSTVQTQCKDGSRRASSPIPSSPIPDSERQTITPPSDDMTARDRAHAPQPETVGGGGGGLEAEALTPEAEAWSVPLELQEIAQAYPPERVDPGASANAFRDLRRNRQWPGRGRVERDILARLATDEWTRDNGRFVPKLSRYIRERMWLNPLPQARASPGNDAMAAFMAMSDDEIKRLANGGSS